MKRGRKVDKDFACSLCQGLRFARFSKVLRHWEIFHMSVVQEKTCPYQSCGCTGLHTPEMIVTHCWMVHGMKGTIRQGCAELGCEGVLFSSVTELWEHRATIHDTRDRVVSIEPTQMSQENGKRNPTTTVKTVAEIDPRAQKRRRQALFTGKPSSVEDPVYLPAADAEGDPFWEIEEEDHRQDNSNNNNDNDNDDDEEHEREDHSMPEMYHGEDDAGLFHSPPPTVTDFLAGRGLLAPPPPPTGTATTSDLRAVRRRGGGGA